MPHVNIKLSRNELKTLQSGGSIKLDWKHVGKVLKKAVKPVSKAIIKSAVQAIGIPGPIATLASNTLVDEGPEFVHSAKKKLGGGLWIEHVKKTQQEHGCSYKQALQKAKETYKGGKGIWLA